MNDPCATPEEIARLREQCLAYNLEGVDILSKYTNSALALDVYNGAGPDSWIPAAREILTKAMSLFSPARWA